MKLSKKIRAPLAEFVAMVLFVFVGCGTAVSSQSLTVFSSGVNDNTFLVAVALAFGFGISVLAYTIAPISGGHINPAVTVAFMALGKMSLGDGVMYIVAQFLGAILGAAILWGSTASTLLEGENGYPPYLIGSNFVDPNVGLGSAFLIEVMGTFLLLWTVMMTAVHKKSIAGNIAPVAIGWSVFLAHLVLIPFTGCGINPARSAGPHIVAAMAGADVGARGWWVYYTAPFVGAIAAAFLASTIFGLDEGDEEEAEEVAPAVEAEDVKEEAAAP